MATIPLGRQLILGTIRIYQKFLSLDQGFLRFILKPLSLTSGKICRHTPSCSEYTYQAIYKYGIISGLILGIKRIVRCHPFAPAGFDPLP